MTILTSCTVPGVTHSFILFGPVPSKKNTWKHGKNGVYIPKAAKADIDALIWQAKTGLNKKIGTTRHVLAAIELPMKVTLKFYVKQLGKQDVDNMATTVLDVLQAANLIKNDNLVEVLHAEKVPAGTGQEKTIVTLHVL